MFPNREDQYPKLWFSELQVLLKQDFDDCLAGWPHLKPRMQRLAKTKNLISLPNSNRPALPHHPAVIF